jgi:hypothetical protein
LAIGDSFERGTGVGDVGGALGWITGISDTVALEIVDFIENKMGSESRFIFEKVENGTKGTFQLDAVGRKTHDKKLYFRLVRSGSGESGGGLSVDGNRWSVWSFGFAEHKTDKESDGKNDNGKKDDSTGRDTKVWPFSVHN